MFYGVIRYVLRRNSVCFTTLLGMNYEDVNSSLGYSLKYSLIILPFRTYLILLQAEKEYIIYINKV